MNDFDNKIKDMAEKETIPVPDSVSERISSTLNSLPTQSLSTSKHLNIEKQS